MVLEREVVAQDAKCAEVDRTSLEQFENHGKSPSQTRRGDPVKGLAFTQPHAPKAVVKERRTSRLEVQPPRFDFRQVRDDARFQARTCSDQSAQVS